MLRVQTVWSGVGQAGYTSHYFDSDDLADAPECHQMVGDFWQANRLPRVPGAVATVQPEVQRIDHVSGQLEGLAVEPPIVVAGNAAAQERVGDALQVLIRLRTAGFRNGRRVRGRLFVPGTAAQYVSGGNFGSVGPTVYQDSAVALRNEAEALTAPWVVWSRPRRVDENTQIPGEVHPVTDSSVWTEFAVLRSRRG